MEFFGNGDVMSYDQYKEALEMSGVDGIMIGRGKEWSSEDGAGDKYK